MTELVNAKNIKTGDLVMVSYPIGDKFENPAKKLEGQEFVVKSIHHLRHRNQRTGMKYFELYGAVSDMGVHYAFLTDELIKL